MNKQDLETGLQFMYNGHFMRLKRKPIRLDLTTRTISDADELMYHLLIVAEDWFIVFHNSFGNVKIFYKECKLI